MGHAENDRSVRGVDRVQIGGTGRSEWVCEKEYRAEGHQAGEFRHDVFPFLQEA
jgi:hypothetical protein